MKNFNAIPIRRTVLVQLGPHSEKEPPKLRMEKWRFPTIRSTFLRGFLIIRTIVYWGLYWGTLVLGNCQVAAIRV